MESREAHRYGAAIRGSKHPSQIIRSLARFFARFQMPSMELSHDVFGGIGTTTAPMASSR
eukprot:scaffold999_cov289-Pinguiococcus_pyrenoidosus.AAC.2